MSCIKPFFTCLLLGAILANGCFDAVQSLESARSNSTNILIKQANSACRNGDYAKAQKLYLSALDEIRKQEKNGDDELGVLSSLGDLGMKQRAYVDAERWFKRYVQEAEKLYGSNSQCLDSALESCALLAAKRGDLSLCESTYAKLLVVRESALPATDPECLAVHLQMAVQYEKAANRKKSEQQLALIAGAENKVLDWQNGLNCMLKQLIGRYEQLAMWSEIDIAVRKIMELELNSKTIDQKLLHDSLARIRRLYSVGNDYKKYEQLQSHLLNLPGTISENGKQSLLLNQAEEYEHKAQLDKAIGVYRRILSDFSVGAGGSRSFQALVISGLLRTHRAKQNSKELLAAIDEFSPVVAGMNQSSAFLVVEQIEGAGEQFVGAASYDNARKVLQCSKDLLERIKETNTLTYASNLHYLAYCLSVQGKYAEAESLSLKACRLRQKLGGDKDSGLSTYIEVLAGIYLGWNKPAKAEENYRLALAREEVKPRDSGRSKAIVLYYIGYCLYCQGKFVEAKRYLQEGMKLAKTVNDDGVIKSINNVLNLVQAGVKESKTADR